jgi:hypothetical protein
MAVHKRLGLIAAVLLAAGMSTGCNLFYLPIFLFGPEPTIPAEMKQLGSKDKRNEISILVLTYAGPEMRPEFIKVDRDLAALIANEMRKAFEVNQERVKVVSTSKVEKFKQEHLNWQSMEPAEIGKRFDADWVVYVEIDNDTLSLYERGSGRELFRGNADFTVTLVNVHDPEEGSKRKQLKHTYPGEAKAIQASDSTAALFKQTFLEQIARKVAWCVTAHPSKDKYGDD